MSICGPRGPAKAALHTLHHRSRGFAGSLLAHLLHRAERILKEAGELAGHLFARSLGCFNHLRIALLSCSGDAAIVVILRDFLLLQLFGVFAQPLLVLSLDRSRLLLLGRERMRASLSFDLRRLIGIALGELARLLAGGIVDDANALAELAGMLLIVRIARILAVELLKFEREGIDLLLSLGADPRARTRRSGGTHFHRRAA